MTDPNEIKNNNTQPPMNNQYRPQGAPPPHNSSYDSYQQIPPQHHQIRHPNQGNPMGYPGDPHQSYSGMQPNQNPLPPSNLHHPMNRGPPMSNATNNPDNNSMPQQGMQHAGNYHGHRMAQPHPNANMPGPGIPPPSMPGQNYGQPRTYDSGNQHPMNLQRPPMHPNSQSHMNNNGPRPPYNPPPQNSQTNINFSSQPPPNMSPQTMSKPQPNLEKTNAPVIIPNNSKNEPVKPLKPTEPECTEEEVKKLRDGLVKLITEGKMSDPRYETLQQELKRSEHQLKVWEIYRKELASYEMLMGAKNDNSNETTNETSTESSIAEISEKNEQQNNKIEWTVKQKEMLRAQQDVFRSLMQMTPPDPKKFSLAVGKENIKKVEMTKVNVAATVPGNLPIKTHPMPPEQIDSKGAKNSQGFKEFEANKSDQSIETPEDQPAVKKREYPLDHLRQSMIEFSRRTKLTPIFKPKCPDLDTIFRERDQRVQARIEHRIMVLSNLPPLENKDLEIKAQTELRALRLIGLQRKVRREVVEAYEKNTSLSTVINMKHYRRTKKISLREARVTEKLEKQRELVLEQRKRQRYNHYIDSIMDHANKFTNYHKNVQIRLQKQSQAIITYHKNYERDRKREEERLERERLRLLQQDDEDGYRKLIDAKKNKRLAYLLDQTDDYLMQMMSLVRDHQVQLSAKKQKFNYATAINIDPKAPVPVKYRKTGEVKMTVNEGAPLREHLTEWLQINHGWVELTPVEIANHKKKLDEIEAELEKKRQAEKYVGKTEEEIAALKIEESIAKEDADSYNKEGGGDNADYYSVAHNITEEVKEQPTFLKFGTLKPYQMKGLEWMVSLYNNNLNGILADEMGLGKTIQTIALVTYWV